MARKCKFTPAMLENAVREYADAHAGKNISADGIAKWADENMPGMKGVRGYHFLRSKTQKGPEGERVQIENPAKLLIKQYNEEIVPNIGRNPILTGAAASEFAALDPVEQEAYLQSVRNERGTLKHENAVYRKREEQYMKKIEDLSQKLLCAEKEIKKLKAENNKLIILLKKNKKAADQDQIRDMGGQCGIKDGRLDMDALKAAVHDFTPSINSAVRRTERDNKKAEATINEEFENFLEGL